MRARHMRSLVPGLSMSTATAGSWTATAYAVIVVAAVLVGALIVRCIALAFRAGSRTAAAAFVTSRLVRACESCAGLRWAAASVAAADAAAASAPAVAQAIAAVYAALYAGGASAQAEGRDLRGLHLHHWLIAWFVATWGAHSHACSAALLVGGAGVFAQGLGAYGASAAFLRPACRAVLVPAAAVAAWAPSVGCSWDASAAKGVYADLQARRRRERANPARARAAAHSRTQTQRRRARRCAPSTAARRRSCCPPSASTQQWRDACYVCT